MEYSSVLMNVGKHIALNESEEAYFTSLLTSHQVARKELLLKEADKCSSLNYVVHGALRAYYRDTEGNENIIMFALQDWWVTDMYAFISQSPAMLTIDALEDSTVLQLSKTDFEGLTLRIPKFERFFRIIMQNAYIREQLRVIENLSKPAEERYLTFIKKYPQVVERVPLKQIASYLGITPEFLSVVRKNVQKNKIS